MKNHDTPVTNEKTTHKVNSKNHIETFREVTRFPCNQCEYKATTTGKLQKHIDSIHKGVCYPCGQCDYKATVAGSSGSESTNGFAETALAAALAIAACRSAISALNPVRRTKFFHPKSDAIFMTKSGAIP